MIGYADTNVLMALQEMWAATRTKTQAEWRAIFDSRIPPDLLNAVWDQIGDTDIAFRSVWSTQAEVENDVIIAVELTTEELNQAQPLGYAYRQQVVTPTQVQDSWSMQLTNQVTIFIFAENKDVVRALHSWVKAALLSSLRWLIATGIDGLTYLGGRDLSAAEFMRPDAGNFYLRQQVWGFRTAETYNKIGGPTDVMRRYVTVHDVATFTNAVRDAESRTVIPLADNLPGGLVPDTE